MRQLFLRSHVTSPIRISHNTIPRILRRSYISATNPSLETHTPLEKQILTSALSHVPTQGFTLSALRSGCRACSYLDATSSTLFPRGAIELVLLHLQTCRERLSSPPISGRHPTDRDIKGLILRRLAMNKHVLPHLSHALGLMSLAENIPSSLKELGRLSDEILYLSGDGSVDTSWYTKRAGVMAVYAAAEVYQVSLNAERIRNGNEDMVRNESAEAGVEEELGDETAVELGSFVDRRLDEMNTLGRSWKEVALWAGFQGISTVNLVRSLGFRI